MRNNFNFMTYCLIQPKGNERIGRMGRDGEHLKKIIRAQSRKSFLKGLNQSRDDDECEAHDDCLPVQTQLVSREELYDTMADAVPERSEALDHFFQRFADKHAASDGWVDLFENLAMEYAKLAEFIKGKGDSSAV